MGTVIDFKTGKLITSNNNEVIVKLTHLTCSVNGAEYIFEAGTIRDVCGTDNLVEKEVVEWLKNDLSRM